MIALVVENCAGCPFVIDPGDGNPWFCDANGFDDDDAPRQLPAQLVTDGAWPSPPFWCPLRANDRLVTLRIAK